MVVITISEIIGIGVLALLFLLVIILFIYAIIDSWIDKHFRKNCYKCKYWKLDRVAGAGGICWYRCAKKCLKENEIEREMNDREYYVKCNKFEEEK